ncbi:MAG: BolA family transcriptional regulator [Nitrospirae bacterium]|nr:BolA family transcriptional regulator [Nitrospirota bacterium]MBI3352540.1 BolA family transcriptional regulator [Nitrospirota bacterium]
MKDQLSAAYVEIEDESWKHEGHAGAVSGGGHFNMIIVSDKFKGINLLNRNRIVFNALTGLMNNEIHALAIKAKTPEEWNL